MDDITKKLQKMMKSKKNKKIVFKQSNKRSGKLIIDDI